METIDADLVPEPTDEDRARHPLMTLTAHGTPTIVGLPFADPEALKAQLARYTATRGAFLDWIKSSLVAGTDYLVIHRKVRGQECAKKSDATLRKCECGGKATLAKPGSEKICGLLQLTPRFRRDAETVAMLGTKDGLVAYVCELVATSGTVVAEGRGCRSLAQEYGGEDPNKTVKMAEKSAMIDAVLRVGGLSELFTQDLEDMHPKDLEGDMGGFTPPTRASATQGLRVEKMAEKRAALGDAEAKAAVEAWNKRQPPIPQQEGPPADALSPGKVKLVWALIHNALGEAGVADTQDTVKAVSDALDVWALKDNQRPSWQRLSWKRLDAMKEAIPGIVATLQRQAGEEG